jgi:hypothetical protein
MAAGTFALFVALIPYRSAEPQLLGRWSFVFAVLLGAVVLAFLLALRELRKPPLGPIDGATGRTGSRVVARCLDLGVAIWGSGYLVGTLFDPSSRGRLLALDLLGSGVPAASLMEWGGAMVVLAGAATAVWASLAGRSLALAATVVVPVTLLGLGEGIARWFAAYRPHPTELATAADARWTDRFVRFTAEGFRDRPHPPMARARTDRLLVVGGTDAFGVGIDELRDRFAEQVASRLEPITDRLWEPIVAGERGARTPDQMRALVWGLRFDPDVVLILYSFDDARYLAPSAGIRSPLEGVSGWRDRIDPLYVVFLNSVLFQEIYLRVAPWIAAPSRTAPPATDPYATPALLEEHLGDLRALVAAATDTGRVVAIIPVDVEVGSDQDRRTRYRAFVASADSAGLPVWSVEQAFRGQSADALIVGRGFRHPNTIANGLLAELVATRLRGALPGPAIPIITLTP